MNKKENKRHWKKLVEEFKVSRKTATSWWRKNNKE